MSEVEVSIVLLKFHRLREIPGRVRTGVLVEDWVSISSAQIEICPQLLLTPVSGDLMT